MKLNLAAVATLIAASSAGSVGLHKRAITTDLLNRFKLTAQYSHAAYCTENNVSPGTHIKCSGGTCPLVESADVVSQIEFSNVAGDISGYVAVDRTRRNIVVAFAGTDNPVDWLTNIQTNLQPVTNLCPNCLVHQGFLNAWNAASPRVLGAVSAARNANSGFRVLATGHSLGGALATLAAGYLRKSGITTDLYTFGSPRVGNSYFAGYIGTQNLGGNFRVTNKRDIVPRLLNPQFYSHVSPEFHNTSPDQTVTEAEITEIPSSQWQKGNAGYPDGDVENHQDYFGRIASCAS